MKEQATAEILRVLNEVSEAFRSTMTEEERAALDASHAGESESVAYAAGTREEALAAFTADALQTLADDMHLILEARKEKLYRQALDIYYAAEELARDPEHADLAEQAEALRQAHIQEYGYPPPPRS